MNAGSVLNGNEIKKKKDTASINTYFDNYYKDDKKTAEKIKSLVTYDSLGNAKVGGVSLGAPETGSDGNPQYSVELLKKAAEGYDKVINPVPTNQKTTVQTEKSIVQPSKNTNSPTSGINNKVVSESNRLLNYLYGANPYDTEAAKSIRKAYDIEGEFAKNGALAEGSARNSGNLDSYAAANALKQRAAYASLGDRAILEQHNATISNIKDIIGLLGEQSDRMFNQNQDALNSEIARKMNIASITGYVPEEWRIGDSDKTAAMQELKAKNELENKKLTTDAALEYARLEGDRYKTDSAERMNKYDTEANLRMHENELAHSEKLANKETELEKWKATLTAEQQRALAQYDFATQLEIMDRQHQNNLTLKSYDLLGKEASKAEDIDKSTAKYIAENEAQFSEDEISAAKNKLGENLYLSYKNEAENKKAEERQKKIDPETLEEIAMGFSDYLSGAGDQGAYVQDAMGTVFSVNPTTGKYKINGSLTPAAREALLFGGYEVPRGKDKNGNIVGRDSEGNYINVTTGEPYTGSERLQRGKPYVFSEGLLSYIENNYPSLTEDEAVDLFIELGVTPEEVAKYNNMKK